MKELQHLNKYFFKYKYQIIIGIIITIVSKLFIVFVPQLIGSTIDIVNEQTQNPSADLAIF